MGGDKGLSVTLPAALNFLKKNENVSVILVGNPELLKNELKKHSFDPNLVSIVESTEVVLMDEQPVQALRRKTHTLSVAHSKAPEPRDPFH